MSKDVARPPKPPRCQLLIADFGGPYPAPSTVREGGRMERCNTITELVKPISSERVLGICAEHAEGRSDIITVAEFWARRR